MIGSLNERVLDRLADDGDDTSWEIVLKPSSPMSYSYIFGRCSVLADAEAVEREDHDIRFDYVETHRSNNLTMTRTTSGAYWPDGYFRH
ncbi:hypothetical protein [Halorubrum kocurii]|uniref:Uncharacterized protein n=1 Tax=Halorubrum kocurii JCM 14978 TaxID=1230456 RepID=M0PJY8_9EURY|nr:hypothetical protein [Halorubrum kocurii]EMA70391.1 hypothetical protein C468_00115 [Halorubrum kocurii JCM 14978]